MVFTQRLAPRLAVPADFGIEHLGSPSHSNLTFYVKEGENILANSMIVSLNSPVVDDITTNLLLTSVDVEDFERDVVQCFVEGCYTGRIENMSRDNFREVNKMAHVFKVSWMQGRCADFFQYLLDEIPEDYQYEDLLYLFEEAFYVQNSLKMGNSFINKVINKFSSVTGCNNFFIPRYIMESRRDEKQLDVLVRMAGNESEILVKCVINQLTADNTAMSDNCRYLLQKVNLRKCLKRNPDVRKELIESLGSIENPAPEDYILVLSLCKLVLSLHKTSDNDGITDDTYTFQNLFNSFETINTFDCFDDIFNFLSASPQVASLYMFIEGIYCWLFNQAKADKRQLPEDLVNRIVAVRQDRGWDKICTSFMEGLCPDSPQQRTTALIEKVKNSGKFTSADCGHYIQSTFECMYKDFFLKENDIEFTFDKTKVLKEPCSRPGECGFILHVTPCTEEAHSLFNIQLLDDPAAYPSHIHFHDDVISSTNMHIVLTVPEFGHRLLSVSWYGKPEYNTESTMWRWGANYFNDEGESTDGFTKIGINRSWTLGKQTKIVLAVFLTK